MPKLDKVPAGELVGDIPNFRTGGRGAGRGQGQAAGTPPAPPPPTGFVGPVFNYAEFDTGMKAAKESAPAAPYAPPDGSLFVGDKGLITTGTYGENTRLLPIEKMESYRFPSPLLTRSPGHYRDWIRACKGGDPACSNLLDCRSVHRVDRDGCNLPPCGRQTGVGSGEVAVHQQQRS